LIQVGSNAVVGQAGIAVLQLQQQVEVVHLVQYVTRKSNWNQNDRHCVQNVVRLWGGAGWNWGTGRRAST
jgi:hypothetical protein